MGRKHSCTICASDPAITSQVNAQIESGVRQKVIHEQFPQFSVSQISRHTRGCLAPKPTGDLSTEQGSAEIARWLERAESTFLVAQSQGDTKSAASAISTAVRTLSAMHKKQEQEAKAEKAVHDPTDVQFTVAQIDALIKHDAEHPCGDSTTPRCLELLREEPDFGELVQRLWANRNLLPALLGWSNTELLAERVSEHVNANN
jgi:hypothetical protein